MKRKLLFNNIHKIVVALFISLSITSVVVAKNISTAATTTNAKPSAAFNLMQLPYPMNALKPYISEETLQYHYGKHHRGYVNKLNQLIAGTPNTGKSLEDLLKHTTGDIFNNAAQVWNHNFYWQCLTPQFNQEPQGLLLDAINKKFKSVDNFKKEFKAKALANFGSGWTWLVKNSRGELEIVNTSNAGNPLTANQLPLLTCDVWEHAYYIDYRNERNSYLDNFWKIVNWRFVEKNFSQPQ